MAFDSFDKAKELVTLHVSVWVEIQIAGVVIVIEFRSRSTWACELKFEIYTWLLWFQCHAPRERVSWNFQYPCLTSCTSGHAPRERVSWNLLPPCCPCVAKVTLHVSVWVEIFGTMICFRASPVTLHVSVWVEIFCKGKLPLSTQSRSTWACELKYAYSVLALCVYPSRSTWACELKFLHRFQNLCHTSSRSTWACELKYQTPLMNK